MNAQRRVEYTVALAMWRAVAEAERQQGAAGAGAGAVPLEVDVLLRAGRSWQQLDETYAALFNGQHVPM